MTLSTSLLKKIRSKSSKDWKRITYSAYKDLKYAIKPNGLSKQVVCIVGCQRSGSTMMYKIFCKDHRTKVFQEFSKLSSDDKTYGIRLNEVTKVERTIASLNHPIVVLKPLVESQNIDQLMHIAQDVKCIWLYRDYKDVAASNLKKFGQNNGMKNLEPILKNDHDNWRSERVTKEVKATIYDLYKDSLSQHDTAALFWWVRNKLYFSQQLAKNLNIYTCKYEDLVSRPAQEMRKVYAFLEVDYPGDFLVSDVHKSSIGKGKAVSLSPEVERLCANLLSDLDQCKD
ncbi:MAG: sulfotransferase domain-containing protein [Bacteroidota bacterium]